MGFTKRAGLIFTTKLSDDVLGWLGLNRASRHRQPGEVEINPVVGVRHQSVERAVAELRGAKYRTYQPPTVSTPIGYVMPQQRYAWWVIGGAESPTVARDLVAALADQGMSFMRSHIELSAIRAAIEQGLSHYRDYKLPVVLALLGHCDEARSAVDQSVADLGDRDDPAEQQYREFADRFQRWDVVSREG